MSGFNYQASVGQSRRQAPRTSAYGQQAYAGRPQASQMYRVRTRLSWPAFVSAHRKQVPGNQHTHRQDSAAINQNVDQLLMQVKKAGHQDISTMQAQMRKWSCSHEKIAELVWRCALRGPEIQILQVIFSFESHCVASWNMAGGSSWLLDATHDLICCCSRLERQSNNPSS